MTDLVITAANVAPGADANIEHGIAGVNVTAGQAVYLDSATGKYLLADNNLAAVEGRRARGIALHGSLANQPLSICRSGTMVLGATMVAGVAYYLSPNPGGVCPVADITTGMNPCLIGFATTTTVLNVSVVYPGVTL